MGALARATHAVEVLTAELEQEQTARLAAEQRHSTFLQLSSATDRIDRDTIASLRAQLSHSETRQAELAGRS
jgi:hypothetical protein